MKSSDQINELTASLVKAQAAVKAPALDSTNPHFKSRFASLAAVREAVIPAFTEHGLAVVQSPGACDGGPTLTTTLVHASGQWWEVGTLCMPAARPDPQGYGSCITYMRRYSLLAIAGVVAEDDDDGERASRAGREAAAPAAPFEEKATLAQQGRLDDLLRNLGVSDAQYEACLLEWKVRHPADLSAARMASILERLEARLAGQSPPPASGRRTTARGAAKSGK